MVENKKVVVGMSGGVDSSAAAYLLKKEGYEVVGITLKLWKENPDDNFYIKDTEMVAQKLGIEHHVVDYADIFKNEIVDYFLEEYQKGRTPNPCIMCNRMIKFQSLIDFADKIGAYHIATGHYAKPSVYEPTGRFTVRLSETANKDQTYALYRLTQEQLKRILMPVGDYEKSRIREFARGAGLSVADKKDSQEICFIPDDDYIAFMKRQLGDIEMPGNFVDLSGNILGRHKGIINYTIGQRKGLGISFGEKRFVKSINSDTNEIVLSGNNELFEKELFADNLNFVAIEKIDDPLKCEAKIRYAHKKAPCIVENIGDGRIKVTFDTPQRAVTPGQSVVLYDGDFILAGGIIL